MVRNHQNPEADPVAHNLGSDGERIGINPINDMLASFDAEQAVGRPAAPSLDNLLAAFDKLPSGSTSQVIHLARSESESSDQDRLADLLEAASYQPSSEWAENVTRLRPIYDISQVKLRRNEAGSMSRESRQLHALGAARAIVSHLDNASMLPANDQLLVGSSTARHTTPVTLQQAIDGVKALGNFSEPPEKIGIAEVRINRSYDAELTSTLTKLAAEGTLDRATTVRTLLGLREIYSTKADYDEERAAIEASISAAPAELEAALVGTPPNESATGAPYTIYSPDGEILTTVTYAQALRVLAEATFVQALFPEGATELQDQRLTALAYTLRKTGICLSNWRDETAVGGLGLCAVPNERLQRELNDPNRNIEPHALQQQSNGMQAKQHGIITALQAVQDPATGEWQIGADQTDCPPCADMADTMLSANFEPLSARDLMPTEIPVELEHFDEELLRRQLDMAQFIAGQVELMRLLHMQEATPVASANNPGQSRHKDEITINTLGSLYSAAHYRGIGANKTTHDSNIPQPYAVPHSPYPHADGPPAAQLWYGHESTGSGDAGTKKGELTALNHKKLDRVIIGSKLHRVLGQLGTPALRDGTVRSQPRSLIGSPPGVNFSKDVPDSPIHHSQPSGRPVDLSPAVSLRNAKSASRQSSDVQISAGVKEAFARVSERNTSSTIGKQASAEQTATARIVTVDAAVISASDHSDAHVTAQRTDGAAASAVTRQANRSAASLRAAPGVNEVAARADGQRSFHHDQTQAVTAAPNDAANASSDVESHVAHRPSVTTTSVPSKRDSAQNAALGLSLVPPNTFPAGDPHRALDHLRGFFKNRKVMADAA